MLSLLFESIRFFSLVSPVEFLPVAEDDAYSLYDNEVLTIPAPGVLSNDSDVDEDTLSVTEFTDPASGTLTMFSDGSFTYAPGVDFPGADSFTYQASVGMETSQATVTISATTAATASPASVVFIGVIPTAVACAGTSRLRATGSTRPATAPSWARR